MRILAGVDASPGTELVLKKAIEVSRAFDATLELIHVFVVPVMYDIGDVVNIDEIQRAESAAVRAQVRPVLEEFGDPDTTITELTGGPARMIVEHAVRTETDLIVVGNRGRGDLASLVLGSTSHGVIHAAPCDVFVVNTRRGSGDR